MRKSIIAVVFALGLVFAATAFAKTYFYDGEGADDKAVKISFDLRGKAGKNFIRRARVEDFTISGATQKATCQGLPVDLPVGHHFEEPIEIDKDRDFRFKDQVEGNDQVAIVKGSFSNLGFVQGRFRLKGDVGGCSVETAIILWDAFLRAPP